jgi:hypothetical protein
MRTWLVAALLLILPLLVYWSTVSHEYGFRDDYAHLREVRERPGWLTTLTTSNGRPIYGVVLEASLESVDEVAELSELRMLSVVLIGVVGVLVWRQLARSGWPEAQAAAVGAAVILLPGSQVVVGWAIAWPIALGLVAALGGFALVERGFGRRGTVRATCIAMGLALYVVASLTYQTSALFAVMPLAAVLLMRKVTTTRRDVSWVAAHVGLLFASLVLAYLTTSLFADGTGPEVARMRIEPHPFIKLLWFARNPLPNSAALFALRDALATPLQFWVVVASVVTLMLLGLLFGAVRREQRLRWLFIALLLPFVAHSVSLAASSQAIGYRTLLPLSGVFLVLAAFGFRAVMVRFHVPRTAEAGALVAFVAVCAFLAHRNALTLIAEPQGREWQLVKAAASRLQPTDDARVYLIRPTSPDHRSTQPLYADEYGSLTADADWAAKEMFKAAMRERYPDGLPQGTEYVLTTGFGPPPPVGYDVVGDLRELKNLGERAPAAQATASQR